MNPPSATVSVADMAEERRNALLEGLVGAIPLGLGLLDEELRFVWANGRLEIGDDVPALPGIGRTLREAAPGMADRLEPLLRKILAGSLPAAEFDVGLDGVGDKPFPCASCGVLQAVAGSDGRVIGIAMVIWYRDWPLGALQPSSTGRRQPPGHPCYVFLERFAHDLKNPLTPILTAAQMLRRYGASKPDLVEWAGITIEHQARQLNAALDEALALAHAVTGKLHISAVPVDIGPVVARTLEAFRAPAEERQLTLAADPPTAELLVRGDAGRLQQMIELLLSHAIETTPNGGRIDLAASIQDGAVVVRIRDTGSGFDAASLGAAFAPFDARDEAGLRSGRGFGLALADALAALQGGTLCAHSRGPGLGTEFVLRLPVLGPPASSSA